MSAPDGVMELSRPDLAGEMTFHYAVTRAAGRGPPNSRALRAGIIAVTCSASSNFDAIPPMADVLPPAHTCVVLKAQEIVTPGGTVTHRKPIIGDMRWDGSVWQRWSGRRWVKAAYSLHPERLKEATRFDAHSEVEQASQKRALDLAVEDQVATVGATVVFAGPSGVVLAYRSRVSHGLHAIMTLLTAGLWAVVWLALTLARREDRVRLEADRWGNVWPVPVAGSR